MTDFTILGRWLAALAEDGNAHVTPIDDLMAHVERKNCWCRPTLLEDGVNNPVVVHYAFDGREQTEPCCPKEYKETAH